MVNVSESGEWLPPEPPENTAGGCSVERGPVAGYHWPTQCTDAGAKGLFVARVVPHRFAGANLTKTTRSDRFLISQRTGFRSSLGGFGINGGRRRRRPAESVQARTRGRTRASAPSGRPPFILGRRRRAHLGSNSRLARLVHASPGSAFSDRFGDGRVARIGVGRPLPSFSWRDRFRFL